MTHVLTPLWNDSCLTQHAVQPCRSKLENLFQPLVDAVSFHDAVSDTEDFLESSYSSHAISHPSFNASPGPPSQSPHGDPSPAENPQPGQKSCLQNETSPNQNGSAHALTSAHHTAATLAASASQAASEQSAGTASKQHSAAASVEAREASLQGLLEVYEEPDSHAGLYNYAKALEDVEAGLLAGFFYKHFCLASNVIGSESKGGFYACTWSPHQH